MNIPIIARLSTVNPSVTRFISFSSNNGVAASAAVTSARCKMTSSGTLNRFSFVLSAAPGVGTSVDIFIYKNSVITTLGTTVADTNTTGNITGSVSYVPGDIFYIQVSTNTGLPASFTMQFYVQNVSASQTLLTGDTSSLSNTVSSYHGLMNSSATTAGSTNIASIMPTAGTISNLYLLLSSSPLAGKSYTTTLVVNGVDTALTATIADTNSANADTTHSVSVSAGDIVYWRTDPLNTPNVRVISINAAFTPTIDGEAIQTFASTTALVTTSGNQFSGTSAGAIAFTSTESARAITIQDDYTVKKLYVQHSVAPGVGKSYTTRVRSNNANTALVVAITDTATAGSDLTHTDTALTGGLLGANTIGAATPTASMLQWSFVTYSPTTLTSTSDFFQMF